MTQGTIKALGQQRLASTINVVTYFIIGLPLAYYLAFSQSFNTPGKESFMGGIYGLAFGQTVALILNCSGFLMIVFGPGSVNRWKKAISEAN